MNPQDVRANVRRKLRSYFKREGAYNFSMLALEAKGQSDEYNIEKFGITSKDVFEIAEGVFAECTSDTLTIKKFLEDVRHIPGYRMPFVNKDFIKPCDTGNQGRLF